MKEIINQLASHNLLQDIVEGVPTRIFWKDRECRYLGCNSLFAKDAGFARPDELTGKEDVDMSWHDQAELYRADDMSVMDSGTSRLAYDEPQTAPDGTLKWLRTSKVPLRDTSGVLANAYKLLHCFRRVRCDSGTCSRSPPTHAG